MDVGVRESEAARGQHHPEDVQEAEDIPHDVRAAAGRAVRPGSKHEEQRRGRDRDVPPAARHGEGPGQLPARMEDEEVDADEASQVEEDEGAEVHALHKPPEGWREPGGYEDGRRSVPTRIS